MITKQILDENEITKGSARPKKDRVYTIGEAMYFLRITRPTLLKYIKEGKIHGTKFGCHWQFQGHDLLAALGVGKKGAQN